MVYINMHAIHDSACQGPATMRAAETGQRRLMGMQDHCMSCRGSPRGRSAGGVTLVSAPGGGVLGPLHALAGHGPAECSVACDGAGRVVEKCGRAGRRPRFLETALLIAVTDEELLSEAEKKHQSGRIFKSIRSSRLSSI